VGGFIHVCGHLPFAEQPDKTAVALLELVSATAAPPGAPVAK
jgi:hypothetical protein